MTHAINRVTVIGAGTMGAAIAGHLANAGIPAFLLDIVPNELTPDEAAKGLTLDHPAVRNRFVNDGMARMVKAKPNNLFSPENAKLITLGNLEDDFDTAVSQSDWIVEVIIERPGPKQALMERIEKTAPAHAIVSSNTSGIPIHIIAQGRSDDFKKRFLGTHFFNPPRYLHLLEIIPTPDTDPAIVAQMRTFAEQRLGKGVVVCKDTPNFVGNRMFSFIMSDLLEFVIENGYTVEEVDKLTGTLLGRPKSATFRLLDVVGIDVMALVGGNLYDLIPERRGPGCAALRISIRRGEDPGGQQAPGRQGGPGLLEDGQGREGQKGLHGPGFARCRRGRNRVRRPGQAQVEQCGRCQGQAPARPSAHPGQGRRRGRRPDLAHPLPHHGLRLQAGPGDRRQPGGHRQRHEMGLRLGDGSL